MILIDLKLALFVVLLLVAGCGVAAWLLVRRALHQQRSPNTALAYVQEELPVGLALLHNDGTVIQANAEAQRVLPGLDTRSALLSHTTPPQAREPLQQHAPSSGFISHPVAIRWWRYPLDQQVALFVFLDQSEYQRLASRQQTFIGQLAHELRTPLTALIAHLDVARNPATSDAIRSMSLDTLQREIHRLARLVRDLLELYRLESAPDLPLCPTNLLLVAEDAIAQIFPQAEQRGVGLTLDVSTPIPLVLAHADRLKQVFLNLLDNAVKYCRPGDRITVRLGVGPEGVHCTIADSGPGISNAELPSVRLPLYRGRTDVEGTGIGLALVHEILRRHQTTLDIESVTGPAPSGTVCSWTLRAAGEEGVYDFGF
jgi:two-component system phosphate regulon sensor histidine kinase PhoR